MSSRMQEHARSTEECSATSQVREPEGAAVAIPLPELAKPLAQEGARRAPPGRPPWLRLARRLGTVVVGAAIVVVLGAAVLVRQSPLGYAELLGHPVMKVVSGSMTPTFRTGDLILDNPLSRAAAGSLHVGEIVTFQEPGSGGAVLVTHRIYRVLPARGGARMVSYETKGDANNAPDVWRVVPSEVLARYTWRIPDGGYVLTVLESRWTLAGAVVLLLAWVAMAFVVRDPDRHTAGNGGRG